MLFAYFDGRHNPASIFAKGHLEPALCRIALEACCRGGLLHTSRSWLLHPTS